MMTEPIFEKGKSLPEAPHALQVAVQRNCHISDARYAGDYSLCTYLLKMREYYRWESGLAFSAKMSHKVVGRWVEQREREWQPLETDTYATLQISRRQFDPFDNDGINQHLLPRGLVYSGGYGRFGKPHFFLARLLRIEHFDDYTVLVSDHEYARDLTAPPAMTRDRVIFVRRESLRRMIWERLEEWLWKKQNEALTRAMAYYEIEQDPDGALEQITDNEVETLILHELGEIMAGDLLGHAWDEMLLAVSRTPTEPLVRSVRDHLADCLSTLPALLTLEKSASIHLYFGSLDGMRKELFPALMRDYRLWLHSGELDELKRTVSMGKQHWLVVAKRILQLHVSHGDNCVPHIEALADNSRL
jgi:hypothetical protein